MKIPPEAKRVFKGIIFDIYQWEQKLFDGSSTTFEMAKRQNSVETIVTQDNEIVFAREEQPGKGSFNSLFGGKEEPNETPLEAAQRELREESGLASDDWELLARHDSFPRTEWSNYLFVARNAYLVGPQQTDAGEKITTQKRNFTDFIDLLIAGEVRINPRFVIDILKMKLSEPAKLEELKNKLGIK